ncbi:MAG: hypothetical protein ABGY13_03400, partial [Verrucomicrobiia bacterium]
EIIWSLWLGHCSRLAKRRQLIRQQVRKRDRAGQGSQGRDCCPRGPGLGLIIYGKLQPFAPALGYLPAAFNSAPRLASMFAEEVGN